MQQYPQIGPVLAAGIMAHVRLVRQVVDKETGEVTVERTTSFGQIWRYAGLDPTSHWEKGQMRPWNAELKKLTFLCGESFVKMQGKEGALYSELFAIRKQRDWERNLTGQLAGAAAAALAGKNYGKDTLAYVFYSGAASPSRVRELLQDKGVPPGYKGGEGRGDEVAMLPPAQEWASVLFCISQSYVGVCRLKSAIPRFYMKLQRTTRSSVA